MQSTEKKSFAVVSVTGISLMLIGLGIWLFDDKGLFLALVGFTIFIISCSAARFNFRVNNNSPKESTK